MTMSLIVAPALEVALHGKLEPSALRGELSGEPYGDGVPNFMWAVAEAEMARTATKVENDILV